MNKEQQLELKRLAFDLFDISVKFRMAADKNASRLEVLKIMQTYCQNLNDLHDFVVNQESEYKNNPYDTLTDQELDAIYDLETEESNLDDCQECGQTCDDSDEDDDITEIN